jgi:hypothetical protein
MSRKFSRATVAAIATASLVAMPVAVMSVAHADQPDGHGPSDPFDDALLGDDGPVEPMKDQSRIERTPYGYRLTTGQQNNHLIIKLSDGRLRFRDTATEAWKPLPRACKAQAVATGIAAVCRVPVATSAADPTLLEVHPRLGNDYIDGRTLPAVFEMAVLVDEGRDTVFTGSGNDFINAAQDPDEVHGGAGNDWIRGGTGDDKMWGDAGNDYMVGQDGVDSIDGGTGTNRIFQ